ncbi:hypothetical protein RND81_01G103900 [Saponaria officinalis]|uniref:Sacsin/Nov domain-containing protein n=1 Tax=Saponaria officinalis TaxID=3572 RepID=A0AAW1NDZ6_SAPOF
MDLHHAVTCLSAELYTKDVHFLMELLQNAEDNQYAEGVEPTLEFVVTAHDIIGCDAAATLLIFNNEVGFSRENMASICSVARSTKKGKQSQGFIGEKGIGFKSVFLVSKQPHIISNGYEVKFNEEPDMCCGVGYIVPEWISDTSFVSKIRDVYGSENLPTTEIILSLKDDKIESVKEELSSLHPELLLFLTKLKRLYVHTDGSASKNAGSVTAISIVNETNHIVSRDKDADSRVVHLSVKDKHDSPEEKCQYYIWRRAFPVRPEAKVGGRAHVKKWIVSLPFPFGKRLKRGTSSIRVFAFLPTSMVTNFPFVIHGDFILASSRETIMFDNKWNQGILGCVPLAFVNAFKSCVEKALPVFTLAKAFEFLPSQKSPFPELNKVRETIKNKLLDSVIIPCETFSDKMTFCRPVSAVRVLSHFRDIFIKMKKSGVSLAGISSMEYLPVHSSLDEDKYEPSLDFLCIAACDLVMRASDKSYVELLLFVTHNLKHSDIIRSFPLLKFSNELDNVALCPLAKSIEGSKIQVGAQIEVHAWLHECNLIFGCPNKMYFLPSSIQLALKKRLKNIFSVFRWLSNYCGVKPCSVFDYRNKLRGYVLRRGVNSQTAITFAHFLYHSHRKKFLTDSEVFSVIQWMPVIDGSGGIRSKRTQTLVPASGTASGEFAGEHTPDDVLLNFLTAHAGALDLPELIDFLETKQYKTHVKIIFGILNFIKSLGYNAVFYPAKTLVYLAKHVVSNLTPPDMSLQVASTLMTSEQAFLLLDWIRFQRTRGSYVPESFIDSIRSGKWVKTTSGVDCPTNCTIPNETGKAMLETVANGLAGFSILDEKFYGDRINLYIDELQFLGVRCGVNGVQDIVMDHFKLLSSSPMSRTTAFSLLTFIGFLKIRQLLEEQWLDVMSVGKWLKTFNGHASPRESVFLPSDSEAEVGAIMTHLHVLDMKFYGEKELSMFLDELKVLGLKSEIDMYSRATQELTFTDNPLSLTSSCGFLLLKCYRYLKASDTSFINKLRGHPWLKTSTGFNCSSASVLYEPSCASLLNLAKVPLIDENFYGNEIRVYKDEPKALGVVVEFADVVKIVVNQFKMHLLSSNSPGDASHHLRSLLHYCMCQLLSEEYILKARHGLKRPKESILCNLKWAYISQFVDLSLIDDSFDGNEIYAFAVELKMMGVLSSLKDDATLVAVGLSRPIDKELLTAEGTLSLLYCLKEIMGGGGENPCIKAFFENLKKSELLMTSYGFRLTEDSFFFFHGDWKNMLDPTYAPFLTIGVKFDPMEVCSALSLSLQQLDATPPIKRIYGFLKEFKWKPKPQVKSDWKIWIPVEDSFSKGKWVDSSLCVIKDKAHQFTPILYSLDTFYENELLPFFSSAFGNLVKVPTTLPEGGNLLVNKERAFVPDDLWLKNLFTIAGDSPSFIWLPKSGMFSAVNPQKLSVVYDVLGVRKLSKSVKCSITLQQFRGQSDNVDLKKKLIVKGLIEIILGFLACKIHMAQKDRRVAARSLLSLLVFENNENAHVSYRLHLADDRYIERDLRPFIDGSISENQKASAEMVNCFAVEIAEGLLPQESETVVSDLRNVIQLGLLYGFEEHSIHYLLTRENGEHCRTCPN